MAQAAATAALTPFLNCLPLSSKVSMRRMQSLNSTASWRTRASNSSSSSGIRAAGIGGKQQPPTQQGLITVSSNISIEIPLRETTEVSVNEYLSKRPRIVRAAFSDCKSERLNEDEWSIHMVPIQFLFISANPVIVVRCTSKSRGEGYPPAVPSHATSVLELEATGWELRGVDRSYLPSHMAIDVRGAMYPDNKGKHSHLKGHIDMKVSCVFPPVFAFVPEKILKDVAEAVLRNLAEKMKRDVDAGLYADFKNFSREKLMEQRSKAKHSLKEAKEQQFRFNSPPKHKNRKEREHN